MVILLWLYSFYRLWMVWAYTLNFDGVSLQLNFLHSKHEKANKKLESLVGVKNYRTVPTTINIFKIFSSLKTSLLYFVLILFSKGKTCNLICYMETIFPRRTNVIGYRYKKTDFLLNLPNSFEFIQLCTNLHRSIYLFLY